MLHGQGVCSACAEPVRRAGAATPTLPLPLTPPLTPTPTPTPDPTPDADPKPSQNFPRHARARAHLQRDDGVEEQLREEEQVERALECARLREGLGSGSGSGLG